MPSLASDLRVEDWAQFVRSWPDEGMSVKHKLPIAKQGYLQTEEPIDFNPVNFMSLSKRMKLKRKINK